MSKIERQKPQEQCGIARRCNFESVESNLTPEQAKLEASRCLKCKNAQCVRGCPVAVNIPGFIGALAEGDVQKAGEIIRQSNMLPSVCGRVCPQERQCESKCILGLKSESVSIGALERFVGDVTTAAQKPIKEINKKVAIVGSGCAGMAAAADLRSAGFDVTIFEALHEFGGVLRYGIPPFRLPRDILDREIQSLKDIGVKFVKNVIVGKSITIKQLKDEGFDAVFICSGAGLPKMLGVPGENLNGVYSANEFLTRVNLMQAHEEHTPTPLELGSTVAVIGGGNVAMDAARTAVRVGYKDVYIVYRRTEDELPARLEEIRHAREEGVIFKLLHGPVELIGREGHVTEIRLEIMDLGEPDGSGRRRPVPTGKYVSMPTDTVIIALGTGPNPIIQRSAEQENLMLKTDKWSYIIINEHGETSVEGVYAGGDVAPLGESTAINAMGAGKTAAKSIIEALGGPQE